MATFLIDDLQLRSGIPRRHFIGIQPEHHRPSRWQLDPFPEHEIPGRGVGIEESGPLLENDGVLDHTPLDEEFLGGSQLRVTAGVSQGARFDDARDRSTGHGGKNGAIVSL